MISQKNQPLLRVIVPYYQGDQYLRACLESIAASTYPVEEIIVVDNCPSGLRQSTREELKHVPFTLIQAKPGIGFGRACNVGIEYSVKRKTDIIVLLNQDAYLLKDCLGHLVNALLGSPSAWVAAPISQSYDAAEINDFFVRLYLASNLAFVKDLVLGQVKFSYAVSLEGINGSCLAIAAQELKRTKTFDPLFHMYGEEKDLFQRGQALGLSILLVPAARIGHKHSNATAVGIDRVRNSVACTRGDMIRKLKSDEGGTLVRTFFKLFLFVRYLKLMRPRALRIYEVMSLMKMHLGLILLLPKILLHRRADRLQSSIDHYLKKDVLESNH